MPSNLLECFSWRVLTEVARISPENLRILELHPGGGTYDCLALFNAGNCLVQWNRKGGVHFLKDMHGTTSDTDAMDFVDEYGRTGDVQSARARICREIKLSIPDSLPSSTGSTIAYRYVCAVLEHSIFKPETLECRNGFRDTSGDGGGVSPSFSVFPEAEMRMKTRRGEEHGFESAYDFWFIQVDGKPILCISIEGLVWDLEGRCFNLIKAYRETGSILSTVLRTARGVLD